MCMLADHMGPSPVLIKMFWIIDFNTVSLFSVEMVKKKRGYLLSE